MYITLNAGLGYSQAIARFENEEGFKSLSDFKLGYNIDLTFDYFYNDGPKPATYGFAAGFGYSAYNAKVSVESFGQSFQDSSAALGKVFTRNVSAKNIEQDLSLKYIDIPLAFKMKYKPKNYFNLYSEIGIVISYLYGTEIKPAGSGEIKHTGTFEYKFPDGTQIITMENIPYYGFDTYTSLYYSNETTEFESINLSPVINAGVMFWLSPRISLNFEAMYRYGLINLVKEKPEGGFKISENEGNVNNIFANCKSLNTNALIFNAGLSFFLKSKKQ